MNEWIKFSDRLPPQDGSEFLGYDPNNENKIYVLVFVPRRKSYGNPDYFYDEHYREAGGECYFEWNPTHWMQLPEGPKE